jgi:hypothetical protein
MDSRFRGNDDEGKDFVNAVFTPEGEELEKETIHDLQDPAPAR